MDGNTHSIKIETHGKHGSRCDKKEWFFKVGLEKLNEPLNIFVILLISPSQSLLNLSYYHNVIKKRLN